MKTKKKLPIPGEVWKSSYNFRPVFIEKLDESLHMVRVRFFGYNDSYQNKIEELELNYFMDMYYRYSPKK